ncbi:MAG: hypothetical protein RMJ67_01790 [Elusimicrobiota bacterium]|nr:hypothetical protein [Endomicrobiia bacterium]MCX7910333.1 hypothetical protein [Endomicrobiia bacterium]MDW8165236.1 hypothetical protein [Elusimicrobiota bacterium]
MTIRGIIGLILILSGLIYFYLPNVVVNVYQIIKKYLLDEKTAILNGKKIGLVFMLTGTIFLLSIVMESVSQNKLYYAYKEYYLNNFDKAEKICLDLLNNKPNDVESMFLLGKIYFSSQKYLLAKATFLRVVSIAPSKKDKVEKFLKVIDSKLNKQKNEN